MVEINRDIEYCEQCLRKYGEWFNSPLTYLRELKRTKKTKMCARHRALAPVRRGRHPLPARSQEGDHPHDGELQQQPAGRQEARQIPGEASGAPARTRFPSAFFRLAADLPLCVARQPVSVLQAPTTPAVVAGGDLGGGDAPALVVGSGATGYRSTVIRTVDQ